MTAEQEPLRLGVIGCRLARARYHEGLMTLPDTIKVTAVTDEDSRYARIWARQLGGRPAICEDALDLLARPLDAVLVAAPFKGRPRAIAETLRAELPALVETPFAASLADADDLISLASLQGTLFLPALLRRFDPYFQKLHSLLEEGAIGAIQQARTSWGVPLEAEIPEGDMMTGGWNATLQDLACRSLDLSIWWQGAPFSMSADIDISTLLASTYMGGRRPRSDTLAILLLAHPRGRSTHQFTRIQSVHAEERYFLMGTEGNAELIARAGAAIATNLPMPRLTVQKPGERPSLVSPALEEQERKMDSTGRRARRLLQHFAACVRGEEKPSIAPAEGRTALEAVHAAYLSALEEARVGLPMNRIPDIESMLFNRRGAQKALPAGPE